MAEARSFLEMIFAIAEQKAAAARSRSKPVSASEKPRDVILAALLSMAARLEVDGFSFHKRAPKLKRVAGDLTFEISFQSCRHNIAGRRAAVFIHAGVESRALLKWRTHHPHPWVRSGGIVSGAVAGGQIGNLIDPYSWMEWDFADATQRPTEVENAVSAIRRIILPFFDLFDDPRHAVEMLMPRLEYCQANLVEYAWAVVGPKYAEAAARSFLVQNPAINERFTAAHAEFSDKGVPDFQHKVVSNLRDELARDLAALVIIAQAELGPPTERRDA